MQTTCIEIVNDTTGEYVVVGTTCAAVHLAPYIDGIPETTAGDDVEDFVRPDDEPIEKYDAATGEEDDSSNESEVNVAEEESLEEKEEAAVTASLCQKRKKRAAADSDDGDQEWSGEKEKEDGGCESE